MSTATVGPNGENEDHRALVSAYATTVGMCVAQGRILDPLMAALLPSSSAAFFPNNIEGGKSQ